MTKYVTRRDAYRLAFVIEKSEPVATASSSGEPVLEASLKSFHVLRDTLGAGLPPQELELLAQSLWAALHGLVSLLLARPLFPWSKQNRLIEFHIDRVFAQVGAIAFSPRLSRRYGLSSKRRANIFEGRTARYLRAFRCWLLQGAPASPFPLDLA